MNSFIIKDGKMISLAEYICCFCFTEYVDKPYFCGCGEYKGIMSLDEYEEYYGELDS